MRLSRKPASSDSTSRPDQVRGRTHDQFSDRVLASRLLQEVFEGYQAGDKLSVLDLGGGNARTVQFLSQFRAKVSFVDLLEHADILGQRDLTPDQALTTCTALLELPAKARFDIILLWDVVHHLSPVMLEALSTVLEPHTLKHTRGYGFGSLQADRIHQPFAYGVVDQGRIILEGLETGSFAAHSQQQMNQKFLCMRIAKATLLQEGKLELLFERH